MRFRISRLRWPVTLAVGAFAALALTAGNPAPSTPTPTITLDTPQGTYAVIIDYPDNNWRNDSILWVPATVTLRPVWTDMRPLWSRRLTDLYISATPQRGNRTPITIRADQLITLRGQRNGAYQGQGLVPGPRRLHRIVFRNENGRLKAFRIPRVSAQEGDGDDDPPKDPPEDPPADPPEEDPPEDDDDCSIPPGCEIVNPWTCECSVGLEDPWGESAQQTGPNQVMITI